MMTTVKPINTSSYIVSIFCMMSEPEIYFLSKYPVFSKVVLTIVIMPYILLTLQHCNFVPFH